MRRHMQVYNKSSMFDPNLPNPGADGRLGALAFAGNGSGTKGKGDSLDAKPWADFGPRLGFAWSPARFHEKIAIRGSLRHHLWPLPSGSFGGDQTRFHRVELLFG